MTESGDPLAQFIAECERRFRPEESRSFWDCTEAFAELAGSGFVVEHVNRELARCKREPGYLGSWMRDEMLLHRVSHRSQRDATLVLLEQVRLN